MLKTIKHFVQSKHSLKALRRRLIHNEEGVAAIEFAFVAPVLLALYFGMTEITLAIAADRQVSHAANVAGDLTTQVSQMTERDVEDVMTATLAVIGARSQEIPLITIELNSYQMRNDGSKTIDRVGYARLGPPISAGGTATYNPSGLSRQMLNETSGVVVSRINFRYRPVIYNFTRGMVLSETFVMKPRRSIAVPFGDGGRSSFTCRASSNMRVNCS